MESKIKQIMSKHYGEILSDLEEFMNTDRISLSIKIESDDFSCELV